MAHEGYYSESSNLGNVNELLNEAELYRDQASGSAVGAAASAVDAAASAAEAVTTATAASSSASAAAASAIDSSNYAINSLSSSTNAASSAAAAATSATNSANSAAAAASSATNSANSASAAAASAASINPASLLTKAGNLAGLADKAVSRGNLGIFNFAKNKIINGKMDVSQRGTSFPAIVLGAYSLDRWVVRGNGTDAITTASQQLDAPSANEFQYSHRVAVTTADASIAAAQSLALSQNIEGFNTRDLIGVAFTISFWVRSSKSGVHCVSLTNSGVDRSYVSEYIINAANTWEYKTIVVPGGLITAGTWNWASGTGLGVRFTLAAGTSTHTTADAWQTGNLFATANQVNCLDTVGNIFAITGVQVEAGSVATPFEHRPYGQELALCQRYFVNGLSPCGVGLGAGLIARATCSMPVTMRIAPTVVVGAGAQWFTGTTTVSYTSGVTPYSTPKFFQADISVSAIVPSGVAAMFAAGSGDVTASAEL